MDALENIAMNMWIIPIELLSKRSISTEARVLIQEILNYIIDGDI